MSDVLPDPAEKSDRPVSQDAEGAGKRLLVHNLFAMEAISIAEALGVPSMALSPCLVPQVAPASLQRHFKREHSALYAALTMPGMSLQISSPPADCTVWGNRYASVATQLDLVAGRLASYMLCVSWLPHACH